MVGFLLTWASTGPVEIASKMPYISIFPPKLCNIHLEHIMSIHIYYKIRSPGWDLMKIKHLLWELNNSYYVKELLIRHKEYRKSGINFSILVWHQHINQELSFSHMEQNVKVAADNTKLKVNHHNWSYSTHTKRVAAENISNHPNAKGIEVIAQYHFSLGSVSVMEKSKKLSD